MRAPCHPLSTVNSLIYREKSSRGRRDRRPTQRRNCRSAGRFCRVIYVSLTINRRSCRLHREARHDAHLRTERHHHRVCDRQRKADLVDRFFAAGHEHDAPRPAPRLRPGRPATSMRCWPCRASRIRPSAASVRCSAAEARSTCWTNSNSACCRGNFDASTVESAARRRRQPQILLRRPRARRGFVRDRAAGRSRTGQSRAVLTPALPAQRFFTVPERNLRETLARNPRARAFPFRAILSVTTRRYIRRARTDRFRPALHVKMGWPWKS